jgi:hypothetical protein
MKADFVNLTKIEKICLIVLGFSIFPAGSYCLYIIKPLSGNDTLGKILSLFFITFPFIPLAISFHWIKSRKPKKRLNRENNDEYFNIRGEIKNSSSAKKRQITYRYNEGYRYNW